MIRALSLCCLLLIATGCARTFNTTLPDVSTDEPIALNVETLEVTIAPEANPETSTLPIAASTLTRNWLDAHLHAVSPDNGERLTALVDADTIMQPAKNPAFDAYVTTVSITFRYYTPQRHLAKKESDVLIRSTREVDRNASPEELEAFKAAIVRHIAERLDETVPLQLQKYFPALLVIPPVITTPPVKTTAVQ